MNDKEIHWREPGDANRVANKRLTELGSAMVTTYRSVDDLPADMPKEIVDAFAAALESYEYAVDIGERYKTQRNGRW